MRDWNLTDAAETLAQVVELALTSGPQRVVSRERRAVVVLDGGVPAAHRTGAG